MRLRGKEAETRRTEELERLYALDAAVAPMRRELGFGGNMGTACECMEGRDWDRLEEALRRGGPGSWRA